MKSEHFKDFGIPVAECEVEARRDSDDVPRIWFRSEGNPLMGLDLNSAKRLQQRLEAAGETASAQELAKEIESARRLPPERS